MKWIYVLTKLKRYISIDNIYDFIFLKYLCKKAFSFKIIQLRHVKIKMVIIIVLKLNSGVDSEQGLGCTGRVHPD